MSVPITVEQMLTNAKAALKTANEKFPRPEVPLDRERGRTLGNAFAAQYGRDPEGGTPLPSLMREQPLIPKEKMTKRRLKMPKRPATVTDEGIKSGLDWRARQIRENPELEFNK